MDIDRLEEIGDGGLVVLVLFHQPNIHNYILLE